MKPDENTSVPSSTWDEFIMWAMSFADGMPECKLLSDDGQTINGPDQP